jgi:hypothetical protein
MPGDDLMAATKMAAVAGIFGGVARVLVELHSGVRQWHALVIAGFLGGALGIMAAGFAVWWDADLRDLGWPLLIVASFAGCVGAIGTRILDILVVALQKRAGG